MSIETPAPARFPLSVLPVWLIVAAGAVLVGLLAARSSLVGWLPLVLFGGVIVTFVIQLAIDQKVGLVNRVTLSVAGSVLILAVATAVFALIPA